MQLDSLREQAIQLGSVTDDYMLEIEEFREEAGESFFSWKHKDHDDWNIIVEVDKDGKLTHLYVDDEQEESNETEGLPEEKLKELAISFVKRHYEDADTIFNFEEWKKRNNGSYLLTYVQMEMDLPLPHTGFYLTITPVGRVTDFRYDGQAVKVNKPKSIASGSLLKEKMAKQLKMDLQIIEYSKDLYIDGDDSYKLVYDPDLVINRYTADGTEIHVEDYDEDSELEETMEKLVKPEIFANVYELIGFDETNFTKIREQDLDHEIGTVWRKNDVDIEVDNDDLSMEAFFSRRNDGTLKLKHHRETGLLLGSFSFLERNGPLQLSFDECKTLAYQFFFQLYPDADSYFRYVVKNEDDYDEEHNLYHYEFRLSVHGFPVTFGTARISVNRTTGTIDYYMGPDTNINEINHINTTPSITEEKAISTFINHMEPQLQWSLEYEDNQPDHYELIYNATFETELGNGAYIDAHTGKVIVRNW